MSDASFELDFSYQRFATVALIEITGGTITIDYEIPATGSGTITESIVAGEAAGVFNVALVEADQKCENPDELRFELIGDAAVATD